jgi:hypothetical protein
MTAAIGSTRSDDCGSLKEDGLVYAAMEAGSNSLVPPIPLTKAATRGFHHLVLGRLLCPARHLADFDADHTEYVPWFIFSEMAITSFLSSLRSSKMAVLQSRHLISQRSSTKTVNTSQKIWRKGFYEAVF